MIDPSSTPTEYIPAWVQGLIAFASSAGAVKLIAVWLENRRLAKGDFRETLLERIKDLEEAGQAMQARLEKQAQEIGRLTSENEAYRAHFQHQNDDRQA